MKKHQRIRDIMKLSFYQLVLAGLLAGMALARPTDAQDVLRAPVSIQATNEELRTVLSQLQRQADVRFTYSPSIIQASARVNLIASDSPLGSVLNHLFGPYRIGYRVTGRQIVLFPQPTRPEAAAPEVPEAPAAVTLTGLVTAEGGEPLVGASVVLKGTQTGTQTGADGRYRLTVPDATGTLVFSYVGFVTREVPIGNQPVVNVALVPTDQALSEIVVIGYGTQRKADVTGATSTVTSKDFNVGVINNPLQAVQGKVAGLSITAPNSDPTNNRPIIRLRGIGSLSANAEPLIVIDGVLGAPLNAVAPEDIEKVDVLKDASAAAIYGARGANGVIIITTKRGKAGRTQVDYNAYVGFDSPQRLPRVLSPDAYFARYNELNPNTPSTTDVRTDWFREITRTAVSMNHNLGISGGSEQFNYRGSIAYLQQPGMALNSGMDRLNARLNLGQKALNNRLDVQLNLSANLYDKQFADYGAFDRAALYSPLEPVYNPDGSFNAPNIAFNFQNPVAMLLQRINEGQEKQLLGNVRINLEVLPGLTAGVHASYSLFNGTYGRFTPRSYFDKNDQPNNSVSSGSRNTNEVNDRLVEYTLNYAKTFGRHTVGALVGYTYQYLSSESFGLTGRDFPDNFTYNNLGAGDQLLTRDDIFSGKTESKLDGLLARLNYAYDNRYLLTANFRRDGSSRFGANNRYGYFPSVSAGWRISNEEFMRDNATFSELKLRVGYGVTGNQNGIGDYASRLLFGPNGTYASPTATVNNPLQYRTAYFFSQNANPDLQWETSAMTNIGLDFGLLNNRLTGSLELYTKDTRNLLFTYSVNPGDKYGDNLTYITNSFLANIGTMNNRGVELTLDYTILDKAALQWRTNLNLAHNRNRVVQLSGNGLTFPEEGVRFGLIYGGTNGYGPYGVLKEGLPVGTFWMPIEVGLDDQGRPLYEVRNAEGVLQDPTTDPGRATRQNAGNPQPTLTLGWGNSLVYKNFDLTIFFRGAFGQKVFNASNLVYDNPTTFRANDPNALNVYRTAFEGTNADLRLPGAVSSRYVEDGSFVRLDNLNFGYTLPVRPTWLRTLRAYVAGQNLLLITKYKGLDPEVRSGNTTNTYGGVSSVGDNLAFGLDDFTFYPRSRTVSVGLTASF
jgi:TonB-linked SusC/RagA family outer membrane protein